MRKLTNQEKGLILLAVVLTVFAIFFWKARNQAETQILVNIAKIEKRRTLEESLDFLILNNMTFFKAVSVFDVTNDEKIYGRNDESMLPLASLIKIMTSIIALENDTSGYVVIGDEALGETGDNGLYKGELWDTKELVKFALIVSSNDAARALASYDENFVEKMNEKASQIGMNKTIFFDPTGLDGDQTKISLGSAEDMNKLITFAFKNYPDIFTASTAKHATFVSRTGIAHIIENTNKIADKIPNLLFSKTGYTFSAGGNLSIIFENKHGNKISVTVLGSTMEGRFSDMEKIVDILYNYSDEI